MTNQEYLKRVIHLYDHILKLRKDDDYVVNQPQMDKLIEVLDFFMTAASNCGGKVDPVLLTPKEEHGGVTATFIVFDIYGDDIQKFCDVVRHTSALSIDGGGENGEICISVTVPNVFVSAEGE